MLSLPHWVVLLSGWPRRVVALLAGALGALAMAPVEAVPAMIVPMTMAVWLIDGSARGEAAGWAGRTLQWRSCRAAAGVGWWWGLGYFIAGLWWLGSAFLVDPDKDAWALPFGVLGVPAALAFFPAFGFAVARLFWSPGASRILALAAGLGLAEWLRGLLFTGFPWNAFGMAFGGSLALAQTASVVGIQGCTLLVIALGAAPATLADPTRAGGFRQAGPTLLALGTVLLLFGFGSMRLATPSAGNVPGVHLRILQPNVSQDENFSYVNKDKILADYLEESARTTSPEDKGLAGVTHLIWPESAFPFILARDPDALETIAKALPPNVTLITGAARVESGESGSAATEPTYFNAVQVVGPGGVILDSYDKVHLVPFGEYLPYDHALRRLGLSHFVHIPGGFTPGRHRRLLDVPGLPPVAAIVCYEAIFSGAVLPEGSPADQDRAGVLLNVTNDGWFGRTSGPYQHLAQARFRSIEQGLPLIRAANTGISAIIDPYGRTVSSLPLAVLGVLDGDLPQRIEPPFFARHSHWMNPLLCLLTVAMTLLFRFARRRD